MKSQVGTKPKRRSQRCAYCTTLIDRNASSRIGVTGPQLSATLCSVNCLVDWAEAVEARARRR